jgi:ABC-type polysaccharide/polyol phosphate export permease
VFELIRSVRRHRRLLRDFVVRDLKGRYIGSTMGFFWSIIFPLVNLAIYSFVFRLVLKTRWSDQQPEEQTVLLMFAGIVIWSAFAEAVARTTTTLVENSNLIQKVVFPSEILPVYLGISSWVNMCIGLVFVLVGVVWLGYVDPLAAPTKPANPGDPEYMPLALGASLVLLPALFALQYVFALGLGYFLSALNLFIRDVSHLIGVVLMVWMFSTPIFYPAVLVERANYDWVLAFNPMYWLIEAYRAVLVFGQWPDPALLARFAIVAAATFLLGTSFFSKSKQRFPDLL